MKKFFVIAAVLGLMALASVAVADPTQLTIAPSSGKTLTTDALFTVVVVFNANETAEVVNASGTTVASGSWGYTDAPPNLTYGTLDWVPTVVGTYHVRMTSGAFVVDSPSFTVVDGGGGGTIVLIPPSINNWTVSAAVTGQPFIIRVDWTAAAGATFVGRFDGVVVTPTAISAGTATFSVSSTVVGTHTFAGVVTDANGTASSATNFNVATPGVTPPTAPLPHIDSWTVSEAVINQPIIIRVDWTAEPGADFVGKLDGVVMIPTAISAGTATFSVATAIVGLHTFSGQVSDLNGNASSAAIFYVATPGGTTPVTVVTGVTNISMSEFICVDKEFTLMFSFAPVGAPVSVVMVDSAGGRTYMTLRSNEGGVASFTGIFRIPGASKLIICVDGLAPFTILVNVEEDGMVMFKSDPTRMLFSVGPGEILSSYPRRSPYIGVTMYRVDAPPPVGPLPVKSSFSNDFIRGTVKQGLHKTVGAFTLKAYPDR